MWKPTFEERLAEWIDLRSAKQGESIQAYLERVNTWWEQSPWSPYYLHWDDHDTWPGPWDLLHDNIFCTTSRALGIIYTLALSNHPEIVNASLVEVDKKDNLVLVNSGLYTLNFDSETIVNIKLPGNNITREVTLDQIKERLE